jgi:hypothetical protein
MPFQELAPRTSGQILGASYLNALSENVEWVFGAAQAINMPFQGYRIDIDDITATEVYWYIRHRHRYLHYWVQVDDPLDHIRFKASLPDGSGGVTLWSDETPGGDADWDTYVDTDGVLTVGTWYKLWWEIEFDSGVNSIWINYMAEGDSTSFGTETAAGYSVPPQWERGDTVSHTNMNLYKTALDSARTQLGDEMWNVPIIRNNTEDRGFFFNNRHRWLHYIGDGEIVDPSGAGETVDISGDGTSVVVYDLFAVEWMAEGVAYEVKDVIMACEDYAP